MDSASPTYRRYFAVFFALRRNLVARKFSTSLSGQTRPVLVGRNAIPRLVCCFRQILFRRAADVPQRVFAGETPQSGTRLRTAKFSAARDKSVALVVPPSSLDYASDL
jgi:hypothetical protein